MKNTALFLHNLNIYLFLWHYPFKGLCKSCKKWPSTLRMQYIKSDSAQYHTVQSQSWKTRITLRNLYKNWKYFNPLLSGQGRLELWRKKTGKKDKEKSHDSAQYHTAWRFEKIWISWRKRNQKRNYFNPLVSSIDEKKLGVKNKKYRWTVPLNCNRVFAIFKVNETIITLP